MEQLKEQVRQLEHEVEALRAEQAANRQTINALVDALSAGVAMALQASDVTDITLAAGETQQRLAAGVAASLAVVGGGLRLVAVESGA